ncbi:MAG: hypothetical protein ABFS38_16205 [Bacteroidota bacterium]
MMLKPTIRRHIFSATLLLLIAGFSLWGQELPRDLQKIHQQSLTSFEKDEFRLALSGFRKLMESDPRNAMYSYYAGRCLVELNEQLDEAIELLYGASKRNVPHNVNYYLGLAYHRNYNFTDAQKYYGRFEIEATRQELKEYHIKHMIGTCRSAREITAEYNPFEVLNVTFIDLFDSLQFGQVKMKGGDLKRKPAAYFSDKEEQDGLTGLMFIPPRAVRGDYLFYSGYSRSGKEGAQLFRVKKGAGKSFSDPEEIKVLNTEGDEVMPYFDPIESDLYFASNGHWGIGGFDLYRSHYDSERDKWSEPMNLGFPVNSVMDEYLLLPGSDLGMVMFFSTRQGTDSTVTVYRVHLVEPKKKSVPNDYAMLKDIAHLGGAAADILAELETLETTDDRSDSQETIALEQGANNANKPVITQVTILPESASNPSYQNTLAEALRHQAVSDSLKDLATEARVRVRESDDPNDRWVWQKQIMLWEKKANDQEEIADELYALVEHERATQSQGSAVNVPETIQVDTVMEDLTVYQFTKTVPKTESESKPDHSNDTRINKFDILEQSIYSRENPIPMDVTLPGGAFYKIQLGVFGSAVEPNEFGGISPVTGERIVERGLIKYFAGKFSLYEDASTALSLIRSMGYEDAFIVAWYDGSLISTQKAKQLE